jgi:hypothetical protein
VGCGKARASIKESGMIPLSATWLVFVTKNKLVDIFAEDSLDRTEPAAAHRDAIFLCDVYHNFFVTLAACVFATTNRLMSNLRGVN